MKTLFSVLIFVLLLSVAFAVQIESSENVSLGENMIVKITGNFYDDLTEDNIHFYREHLVTAFPTFDITEIDGDFYFYVQVPLEKQPGDYSIVLQDTRYYSGAQVTDTPVYFNFTIKDREVPFRFSPGFLVTNKSYNVAFQNLEAEKIRIDWGKTFSETTETEQTKTSFWDELFGIEPEENTTTETTVNYEGSIELKSGEEKMIQFNLTDNLGFVNNYFYYNGESYSVLIYSNVTNEENTTNFYDGEENGTTNNGEDQNSDENETTSEEEENTTNQDNESIGDEGEKIYTNFTCDELGYEKCILDVQVCDGDEIEAKDAVCCIGECTEDKPSSTWSIIGWSLLGIVILFVGWFYITKFSKTKGSPGLFGKKK